MGLFFLPFPLESIGGRVRHASSNVKEHSANLFSHGHCQWPGCDMSCPDLTSFQRHLNQAHGLGDKATAQTRVQMQIVSQLELQLNKERGKLDAMMDHLQLESRNGDLNPTSAGKAVAAAQRVSSRSPSPKRFKSSSGGNQRSPERRQQQAAAAAAFQSAMVAASLGNLPCSLANVSTTSSLSASSHAGGMQSPLSALTAAVRSPLLTGLPVPGSDPGTPTGPGHIRPRLASALEHHPHKHTPTSGLTLPPGKTIELVFLASFLIARLDCACSPAS